MAIDKLKQFADSINIAEELDNQKLLNIGSKVLVGYEEDLKLSQEWLNDVKKVEELVALASKKKQIPLPNSANIKYPLITKACYEFSSRTYPEIVRDGKVVKGAVVGFDLDGSKQDQSERVAAYMNYQLLFENQNWERELDRLLNLLALVGFICKKTYYDPIRDQIKSEICEYKDLIISPEVKNLDDAARITHVIRVRLNDLIEGSRSGVFLKEPVDEIIKNLEHDNLNIEICLLEQHTFLDLDEDSYLEPYIVTTIKDSGKVLRIAPRFSKEDIKHKNGEVKYIQAKQFFTDYHFLVSPKGKFQSVGFGVLMLHLNETINTLLNQLTDAGQLANLQGGYIDARLKELGSGNTNHDPGEWKRLKTMAGVTLKEGIMPINYKEPSNVLYQLLGLMIESGKDLSSSTELMSGSSSPENVKSGAVMAMLDQGMKMFTSIQRRIYMSLSNEYRKIAQLNFEYLDPISYVNTLDDNIKVNREDFDPKTINVIPVADPNLSSEAQRIAKNQILLQLISLPGVKPEAVTKRLIDSLNIPNASELLVSDKDKQAAPPSIDVLKLQADMEGHAQELRQKDMQLELDAKRLQLEAAKTQCEILKMKCDAILSLAKAEAAEAGPQIQMYQAQMDNLYRQIDMNNEHLLKMQSAQQPSQELVNTQQPISEGNPGDQTGINPVDSSANN